MTHYETLNLVENGFCAVLLFGTVIVYYRQLKTMQSAAKSQSLLSLVNFLQSNEVRQARGHLITELSQKLYQNWDADDKRAASLACTPYDIAAIMIQGKAVDATPITDNWGSSIRRCYDAARPWMEDMRELQNMGPRYFDNFEWLYSQIQR